MWVAHEGEFHHYGVLRGEDAIDEATPAGTIPMLVMHDAESGAIFVICVDKKGISPRVHAKVVEVLQLLGYARVLLKSDQEPSLVAFRRSVQEYWRDGDCAIEDAVAYDPRSNGAVERAVRSAKDQMRAMKSALD